MYLEAQQKGAVIKMILTSKKKRIIKRLIISFLLCVLVCVCVVFGINAYVKHSFSNKILTVEEAGELSDIDCVLVLGCGVHGDTPSNMLEDRLLKALEVYDTGVTEKMLMTGDHGSENYDEVNVMKNFAKEKGVADNNIFMDHAGFSTYDSIYRADYIFGCKKIIIVTQKYHLYRALYIAEKLGIEAYGVNSDQREYGRLLYREVREILARDKDFVKCIIKPDSTYLGEKIPISGDGNLTNDK